MNDPPIHVGEATVTLAVGGRPASLELVDPDSHDYTVVIVTGAIPPGLSLADNGTLIGEATTAGTYSVTYRACDDQIRAACSEFTVVYEMTLLALTGAGTRWTVYTGLLLTLLGAGLLIGAPMASTVLDAGYRSRRRQNVQSGRSVRSTKKYPGLAARGGRVVRR